MFSLNDRNVDKEEVRDISYFIVLESFLHYLCTVNLIYISDCSDLLGQKFSFHKLFLKSNDDILKKLNDPY